MADNRGTFIASGENAIEWFTGSDRATVTLSSRRHINRIRKRSRSWQSRKATPVTYMQVYPLPGSGLQHLRKENTQKSSARL